MLATAAPRFTPLPEPVPDPMSLQAAFQAIEQNHAQAEEGHARLRGDLRRLEASLDLLESRLHDTAMRLRALETQAAAPIEIQRLNFTPKLVIATIVVCVTFVTGQIVTTADLRSTNRLTDVRVTALATMVDEMKRDQKMLALKFEALEKEVRESRAR